MMPIPTIGMRLIHWLSTFDSHTMHRLPSTRAAAWVNLPPNFTMTRRRNSALTAVNRL